ncbi:hypothetical protein FALCPG4_017182 [Fusarium falciforme]
MAARGISQRDETLPTEGGQRTEFDFDDFDHSNIPFEKDELPVVVIGSSMIGMSLQLFLGFHGIKSVAFDRHPSTATRQRAALFQLRTIEIFRQLGLEEAFREESETVFDLDGGILLTDALYQGKTLSIVQGSDPKKISQISPCTRLWLTQDMYEPWVRERAKEVGSKQFFKTRVVHYEENANHVVVVVQDIDSGKYRKYKTKFLIACDGNRSPTRKRENIAWDGPGILGSNISIHFKADLKPYLGERSKYGVIYVNNPTISGFWRLDSSSKSGFLGIQSVKGRDKFEPGSVTAKLAREYFQSAAELPGGIDIELEAVSYFTMAAYNSERYTSAGKRVILAGDAAHVMPPTGAMGGNTGIQDVYNLAWKLAYVLNDKASIGFLDSYNIERVPSSGWTVNQAYSRWVSRVIKDETVPHDKELPDETCELGYRYPQGAIITEGPVDPTDLWEDPFSPRADVGSRLLHKVLEGASGKTISSLDLVKRNFVILTTSATSPWLDAARQQDFEVDAVSVTRTSQPVKDPSGGFAEALKLQNGQALLIRPDGYIAWRTPVSADNPADELATVLQKLLRPDVKNNAHL